MANVNRWMTKLAGLLKIDGRRDLRMPTNLPAVLSGPHGTNEVRCLEMSRGGAMVAAEHAVEVGTLVFVRMTSLGLMGFAHVRHCRVEGEGWRLGLEFRGGLTREREAADASWRCEKVSPKWAWDEPAL